MRRWTTCGLVACKAPRCSSHESQGQPAWAQVDAFSVSLTHQGVQGMRVFDFGLLDADCD